MGKIWKKSNIKVNKIIEKYNTGDDYLIDIVIMTYDIKASLAHAKMLHSIGILTKEELNKIEHGLKLLETELEKGNIEIKIEDEDCHTVIENFLIEKIGEPGKKIHTGRSRNDQVLVATRLYLLDELKEIKNILKELIKQFVEFSKKHENIVLPGYTHTQQAMLSSVAHWGLSFAESLMNDYEMIESSININNQNPLGTAAGFGVDFPLNRDLTAKLLGFKKNIINSIFAQASRGKFESFAMESLIQVMLTLNRFASDIIFFTTQELDFFHIDESLTTGSSIMPQKKNKDSMELLRGYTSTIISHQLTVKNIIKSLISGYNRDLQLIKKPLIESINIVKDSLSVVIEYLKGMKVNKESIYKNLKNEILAADIVNQLVKQGIPFRDAYQQVGKELSKIKDSDFEKYMKSKKSLGSAGNLGIELYEKWMSEKF